MCSDNGKDTVWALRSANIASKKNFKPRVVHTRLNIVDRKWIRWKLDLSSLRFEYVSFFFVFIRKINFDLT